MAPIDIGFGPGALKMVEEGYRRAKTWGIITDLEQADPKLFLNKQGPT